MPSTFMGLNIGTTGLYTYQAALNTAGHNISNIGTEGYTRQIVNQQANNPISISSSYGMAGTGVNMTGVTQVRNEYYDIKYRENNSILHFYSTKSDYMLQVENYFNEMSVDGFTKEFDNFFDSMEQLTKDPSNMSARYSMVNYAESLTQYFNSLSNNLSTLQQDANYEIKNQISSINTTAQEIASLNKQINVLESYGGMANDLRDQRNLLVDKLSAIANVSVKETSLGNGISNFTVVLNGQNLVETNSYSTLSVVPRENLVNQNDIIGLFDVVWETGPMAGQDFNLHDANLGGSLQALVEMRDGNNADNFQGKATGAVGTNTVKLADTSVNSINKLNIPASGTITIGNKNYEYTEFECKINSDGKYTYEFILKEPLAKTVTDEKAQIGTPIDYKGIPHYMAQLDEFVRTFASKFNEIHNSGQDLYGNVDGDVLDFFNAKDIIGGDYAFDEGLNLVTNGFTSTSGSYYRMTAANICITSGIIDDPKKIAAASAYDENNNPISIENGVENNTIIEKLLNLKDDNSMFKQGKPASFLQTVVSEIGVDAKKANTFAKSQTNILFSIENQRLSISGVDEDEEAMNLIKFKHAYDLSAKVISVMNEMYDKLINHMGV